MKTQEAWDLVGGLSKPSKMPGWSIGIPAKECKTGAKLRLVQGSVCYDCYALKGLLRVQGGPGCTVQETKSNIHSAMGSGYGTPYQQQEAGRLQVARLWRCTGSRTFK